jgi:FKBP-type peptidyl-prolyl cis-trans isomerase
VVERDAGGQESFARSLGIDLAEMEPSATGLYRQDLVEGSGEPATAGSSVTLGYTGWLADGTEFDSGEFPLTLGTGQAIAGFDEGVMGMRLGGRRKLVIPPALGYGAAGSPPVIPPNATLVFEVELRAIR